MKTVPAIYENGVFRPLRAIDLPESTSVEILLPDEPPSDTPSNLDAIYEAMSIRFNSERRDLAERHNEHQP